MTNKKTPKDGSENGRYSENHSKKVLEKLRNEGFLLEILANKTLEKYGWTSNMHRTFWNLPKGGINANAIQQFAIHEHKLELKDQKGREIDIYSVKGDTVDHPKFDEYCIELVIDCKYRYDENWVFYKRPTLSSSPEPSSILASQMANEGSCFTYFELLQRTGYLVPDSGLHRKLRRISHQSWSNQIKPARAAASLFRNDTSIFSACQQIVDANEWLLLENLAKMHYRIGRGEEKLTHFIMYPVIIFDGPMWQLQLENEETMLEPAEWLTFYFSKGKKTYAIDFVLWEAFETYLSLLDDELANIRKALKTK